MPEIFDPAEFVNKIGKRLVMDFEDASVAGTPGLIGDAREHPARLQLEKLMPGFVSTGTGLVMDSFGDFSTQQDIVFYERDLCPVYSINGAPSATYFPVEGVIAVGEVKSTVDKATLFDALDKVRSVKLLRRHVEKISTLGQPPAAPFRHYGAVGSFGTVASDEYDQARKATDQIFGFIICRQFKNSGDAILANVIEYVEKNGKDHLPNLIVSLNDGFLQTISEPSRKLQGAPVTANAVAFMPEVPRAFSRLVNLLRIHARQGRSVPLEVLDRYMSSGNAPFPLSAIQVFVS